MPADGSNATQDSSLLAKVLARFSRKKSGPRPGRPIRVVIELASFDKGGLEKVVLDSAIALDPGSFEATIVTAGQVGYLGKLAEASGLRVVALRSDDPVRQYALLLKQLRADVAISHFSDMGYPLFRKYKIPNITFIHNVYAFMDGDEARAFAENDRFVDCYISVSKNATRYAAENLAVPAQKIVTIPNGLMISEHEWRERNAGTRGRDQLGLAEEDYVFANVASYNLHKGHYLMADAMRHILKTRDDIKILCIGNIVYEPHFHKLTQYLKDEGLQHHILMPGFFPAVEDIYGLADAFLLPSFIEGWSIAMNEAMFYQKPMILTDTGAAAEVIENSDIGVLIPNEYGDTIDLSSTLLDELTYAPREYRIAPCLAAAMIEMADNREMWRTKAKAGRQKIRDHYDFSAIVRQYETIIRRICCRDDAGS